jgi:hypothetical protein
MNRVVNRRLAAVVIAFALCGCAAATLPNADGISYKSRAVSRSEGGLHVSAAVLSDEEGAAMYGVPLASKGIQPVWIEVQDNDTASYFLMSPGHRPPSGDVSLIEGPPEPNGINVPNLWSTPFLQP